MTGGKFANGAYSAAFSAALRADWGSSDGEVVRVEQMGSGGGGQGNPASIPEEIKVEASGFENQDEAAIAAGARYGELGVKNKQELQMAIVRLGEKNYGYLTPGWGPQGAKLVNPGALFDAYVNAGFEITSWMHGHWDRQLNFSAIDFRSVWEKSYPTYMVNSNLEVRKLTNSHLQRAYRAMPHRYKKLKLRGLMSYYGHSGLAGEKL